MIVNLRSHFNQDYTPAQYAELLALLHQRCGVPVKFRVAETPIFLTRDLLDGIAQSGIRLSERLTADPAYLAAARLAIPAGYRVASETSRPNFLTADFALIRDSDGQLSPRLVELQAFPSVYAYQAILNAAYRDIYSLDAKFNDRLQARPETFLSGLNEDSYWQLLGKTIVGSHDPETVVLTEVDPFHQKTLPDFNLTAQKLGIAVVDIASIEPEGSRLTYRGSGGRRIPISRIYNRAIADELIASNIQLQFDLERSWNVEWAGHPNWYFLISKFSIPFLCRPEAQSDGQPSLEPDPVVPPSVFVSDFLAGPGRIQLESAGVPLPALSTDAVYSSLLLKPLFSFAGKGIQFDPTHAQLLAIPPENRGDYLLQQRMSFVPTIETPFGATQFEIRILYLWPDGGELFPAISLARLGRGRMMGVDHNRNLEWVGASGAFFPVA
ncbi:ATP-grasp domain-containing protein [Terracidiphilus gabretensis]|uniref:hypothetical protein n=1 Tax=Terracidiphilus gabretensis TaxID=1577687 RepID=UPI00071C1089|nr:hypothetical protein [Terracidiphilus gabretensis]